MGIPGLKICTASSPDQAYGMAKSMIRDNGPGILFLPVKMMKSVKSKVDVGKCLPLNKARLVHAASDAAVASGKAVTVATYLHGVKEAQLAAEILRADGLEVDLIELTSLKPMDMATIAASLKRTHKLVLLDESTLSGGVGATVSALVSEQCFDLLDAPVKRLCMDDAPVPYASSMEQAVVKRCKDVVEAVKGMAANKY
jgi:pyruvate/2-oxoglutarate/acetoin dehydrogenase E1 component